MILMIIFLFLIETICCDPSSEPSETVQMRVTTYNSMEN